MTLGIRTQKEGGYPLWNSSRISETGTPNSYRTSSKIDPFHVTKVVSLTDDSATLQSYGIENGMIVHCTDFVILSSVSHLPES